mmetsp:Transcript_27172/g.60131  ORF Transcript_27172/g.60131 Transcript_27172/m.60131 type:complete len:203 (+) Transcript_27172:989-1597(+)
MDERLADPQLLQRQAQPLRPTAGALRLQHARSGPPLPRAQGHPGHRRVSVLGPVEGGVAAAGRRPALSGALLRLLRRLLAERGSAREVRHPARDRDAIAARAGGASGRGAGPAPAGAGARAQGQGGTAAAQAQAGGAVDVQRGGRPGGRRRRCADGDPHAGRQRTAPGGALHAPHAAHPRRRVEEESRGQCAQVPRAQLPHV